MKKLLIVLTLLLGIQAYAASGALTATNVLSEEKPGGIGTIIITQNGTSTDQNNSQTKNSIADEWVVPILKLIIWPTLIALLVLLFQKEIRAKIHDVQSFKGGKDVAVEFSPQVREQQKATGSSPSSTGIVGKNEEFQKLKAQASTSAAVRHLAEQISQNLNASNFSEAEKFELGVLTVAGLRIENYFLRVYNFIFGSQIILLQEFNSRNLTEVEIQNYFEGVKTRFPAAFSTWTHRGYLEFLKNFGLIQEVAGQFSITEYGREFLFWMTQNKFTPNKAL
jgi:hypothetical protein